MVTSNEAIQGEKDKRNITPPSTRKNVSPQKRHEFSKKFDHVLTNFNYVRKSHKILRVIINQIWESFVSPK